MPCNKKHPPLGAAGSVAVKNLWPKGTTKRAFPLEERSHNQSCTFTIVGKKTMRVSANKEAMCYLGTVPECKEYGSEDLRTMWCVVKWYKCGNLTSDQKKLDPATCDDVLVPFAEEDGVTPQGAATPPALHAEGTASPTSCTLPHAVTLAMPMLAAVAVPAPMSCLWL
jgi:hypothetical protein